MLKTFRLLASHARLRNKLPENSRLFPFFLPSQHQKKCRIASCMTLFTNQKEERNHCPGNEGQRGGVSRFRHHHSNEKRKEIEALGGMGALLHLRNKPLENALITKGVLTEVLYHARPLLPEILNRLRDEVKIEVPNPLGITCWHLVQAFAAVALRTLALEHVQHTINSAKGSRAPTARTAMYQDRPLALWFRLFAAKCGVAGGTHHLVALLDQVE
jgi:hypothetical protein